MTYRHVLLTVSVILNLILLWALLGGGQSLRVYNGLKVELSGLQERTDALNEKNVQLSREIKLLESDNKYLEQMIRRRLNYIKNNEIWYIFPDESGLEGTNETEN